MLIYGQEADIRWQVYRTDDVYRTLFGKNYSRFYEAFRQGISTPEASQPVATAVPAKRHLAAPSERISKRRRQDDPASLPQSDHHEVTRVSAQPAAVTTRTPTGAEPSEVTSPPREDRESPVRPTPRSYSATKGKLYKQNHCNSDPLCLFWSFHLQSYLIVFRG